jgi:hypothetical protein
MDSRVHGRRGPATYVYRRELDLAELLPAIGAGIVTGLAAFYVARLLLQRTPLAVEQEMIAVGDSGHAGRRSVPPRPRKVRGAAARG